MQIVTRFAPSPTGHLHPGHAHAALVAWRAARAAGGRFLLRIEDIDPGRCRPNFSAAILEDLAWLGLDWDGPVRVQSEHLAAYRAALDSLAERGLLYPCFCTRAEIEREVAASAAAPHGPDGAPLLFRDVPPAWRQASGPPGVASRPASLAAAGHGGGACCRAECGCATPRWGTWRSAVRSRAVRRRWCWPARTRRRATIFASPTTMPCKASRLVTRGEDLREATDLHCLLQALLGWPTPCLLALPPCCWAF